MEDIARVLYSLRAPWIFNLIQNDGRILLESAFDGYRTQKLVLFRMITIMEDFKSQVIKGLDLPSYELR